MSNESAKKVVNQETEAVDAWCNAIRELYTGVYGDPERLASWRKDLIFAPLPECPPLDTDEEKRKAYGELWTWAYTPLRTLKEGYRLGYAIQVLLKLFAGHAKWEDEKARISADENIRERLLCTYYVLNIPGMEKNEDAKALCKKAYRRFFVEENDYDTLGKYGEALKADLDKNWGDVYENYSATKIDRDTWKHGTPFKMGMEQAAEDLKTGFMLVTDSDGWTLRYTGSSRYHKRVPEDPEENL